MLWRFKKLPEPLIVVAAALIGPRRPPADDARLNHTEGVTMDLTPRPLGFSAAALNGLSERLVASHHAQQLQPAR